MSSFITSNMRVRMKLVLQAVVLTLFAAYASLFVYYHNAQPSADGHNIEHSWQERAPRSISNRDYDTVVNSLPQIVNNVKSSQVLEPQPPQATSTVQSLTSLSDVFISVKTTSSFHRSRLDVILKTWFSLAKDETYFFTDAEDPEYQEKTNNHMINTNCSSSHNRKALCCKMSVEFDTFLASDKRWFCHVDDDNYVNVPRLLRLLDRYSSQQDWYLGKPSIRAPLEILDRERPAGTPRRKISFWFATGGAGFCLSRALALKMLPVASGGKFISVGEKIRLPDDVTMGYIIEHLLGKKLTVVDEFHSHLEPMKFLRQDSFADQITFSYSSHSTEQNLLKVDGFDPRVDPTRFLSLHCYLFPHYSFCPR